jgi:hypothetical protein
MNKISNHSQIGKNIIIEKKFNFHSFVVTLHNFEIIDNLEIFPGFPGLVIGLLPNGANGLSRKVSMVNFKIIFTGEGSVISTNNIIYSEVSIDEGTLISNSAKLREKVNFDKNCIISSCVTVN